MFPIMPSTKKWLGFNPKKMATRDKMGLFARNPVFGVYDEVVFKPACSATETS